MTNRVDAELRCHKLAAACRAMPRERAVEHRGVSRSSLAVAEMFRAVGARPEASQRQPEKERAAAAGNSKTARIGHRPPSEPHWEKNRPKTVRTTRTNLKNERMPGIEPGTYGWLRNCNPPLLPLSHIL